MGNATDVPDCFSVSAGFTQIVAPAGFTLEDGVRQVQAEA
jgi:hypothetical protein